ncbi:GNAT family N-acetyltransferase [Aquibaculum arenosum]|uniref:GNAT family N-acetyltransferase n=1 Tax=Aquibaculum arenosum TaxID=3032591 RepID=A0ABT5YLU9_9PROT|nr:GNAT family N-acetyltransferase [Fodinicurvata sp. CAU 1616]MDF2095823.1 GNAT family N-acetyltransferase [Fodinicurvata sp. CAU 1616]
MDLHPVERGAGSLVAPEHPAWQALLRQCPSDSYHQPGYLHACSQAEEGELCIALAEAAGQRMGVPLLLRSLPDGQVGWDACSPYGYPSPLASTDDPTSWRALWEGLRGVLAEYGVIAAFFRLHPLLSTPACLEAAVGVGRLVAHGPTVFMPLEVSEDTLWSGIRSRFRSNINALKRAGWRYQADDWSLLPVFRAIYAETMTRTGAGAFYHFPAAYFEALRDGLGEGASLHAIFDPEGRPASAALFLRHQGIVQYHLGGTASTALAEAPAKLLFHEAALHFRAQGARVLHLGGGLGGREDSLFRFKAGFSKQSATFHSLRMIVDPGRYARLSGLAVSEAGALPSGEGFFPAYRAPGCIAPQQGSRP